MTLKPYVQPMPVRGRINTPQPKGLPVINLGFNELPYPALPAVAEALAATPVQSYGTPHCDGLRAALGRANGIDPDHIVCGNGSEELLDCIARVFARPGDEILISQFGYIQFQLCANRVGATLVKASEAGLTTDIDALLAAVTPATRVLFLANPNNPTGTMIAVAELARLQAALPRQVVLVLDLAYGEFAEPDYVASVHALVGNDTRTIVTRTFSKAFGLAGVRVGWLHAAPDLVPLIYAVRGMGTVNAMAQAAATAALTEMDIVAQRIAETRSERARLSGVLRQRGFEIAPSATNFLLAAPPDATPVRTEALVQHVFDEGGYVVNRTREAGLERFFRFSLGTPEQNDGLLRLLGG